MSSKNGTFDVHKRKHKKMKTFTRFRFLRIRLRRKWQPDFSGYILNRTVSGSGQTYNVLYLACVEILGEVQYEGISAFIIIIPLFRAHASSRWPDVHARKTELQSFLIQSYRNSCKARQNTNLFWPLILTYKVPVFPDNLVPRLFNYVSRLISFVMHDVMCQYAKMTSIMKQQ